MDDSLHLFEVEPTIVGLFEFDWRHELLFTLSRALSLICHENCNDTSNLCTRRNGRCVLTREEVNFSKDFKEALQYAIHPIEHTST